MKLIYLTQGKVAEVDDENYYLLNKYKWQAQKGRYTYYAKRVGAGKERILMHREILNLTKKEFCDHKDGNGLNNKIDNLRRCTNSENQKNKRGWGKSKYKGVCWIKKNKKWMSYISINKKRVYLGLFCTEKEAAVEYNKSASLNHGEFAKLNIF